MTVGNKAVKGSKADSGKDWSQLTDLEAAKAYRDLAVELNSLARNLVQRGMHIQARLDWDDWMMTVGVPKMVVKVLREMMVE
jgi:hypothetical protein